MKDKLHTISLVVLWSGVATLVLALFLSIRERSERIDQLNLRVETLQHTVDSLESKIEEYYEGLDDMSNDLQWKEAEISYWGQKYDSTKAELEKYKKKK